jgi:ammonia channel protein AmtB
MTGLFAKYTEKGAFYGNGMQFPIQIYGIVVSSGWSIFMTYIILRCIEMTIGLRISVVTELEVCILI